MDGIEVPITIIMVWAPQKDKLSVDRLIGPLHFVLAHSRQQLVAPMHFMMYEQPMTLF